MRSELRTRISGFSALIALIAGHAIFFAIAFFILSGGAQNSASGLLAMGGIALGIALIVYGLMKSAEYIARRVTRDSSRLDARDIPRSKAKMMIYGKDLYTRNG